MDILFKHTAQLARLTIILFTLSGFTSCAPTQPISTTRHHFYFVLAPSNESSARNTRTFLLNAEEGKSRIIEPNNSYTLVEICEGDEPAFLVPYFLLKELNQDSIQAITMGINKSLQMIKDGEKKCNATLPTFNKVVSNLLDAANKPSLQDKLVVIIQFPWQIDTLTEQELASFKQGMAKVIQSSRVEKMILFDVSPMEANKISAALNLADKSSVTKVVTTIDAAQLTEALTNIRNESLQGTK